MTLEEIIKKQKEHLTKAQIGELIQATERYKQLNASNRASAMRTLSDQYRATRRGLQNTGLAGRKGKLISGQEKAARIRANEAYRQYNAGLRQIDNAYAQNRAARMSYQNAQANQLAETERIQAENDKEAARINAEYEAWLRKKKAAEDEYKRKLEEIERLRAQQQAQQQQIRERIEEDRTEQSGVVQGNRIQRLAKDKHPQLETSDYARAVQEQAVQRAVNEYQQTQKVFRQQSEADAMYDAMHPGSAITRAPHTDDYVIEQKRVENARQLKGSGASDAEVWFADAYGVSASRYKTVKNENPELIKELTGAIQDLRTKNYDTIINTPGNIYDKHQAREDKAKAESAISKAAVAMGIDDAEMRNLYLMNDTQFAVSYAAAAALAAARQKYDSSDAIQDQMMMSGKSGAFNNATRDAETRLAKFEQVRRLRYDTADKTLYYDTYPTDVQTKDAKSVRSFCAINQNTTPYAWANPKNENGENWYQAAQNGWKAENDGNTKYGALVNDWSLVGGRQVMRYQQTGKVMAMLANVMPHFYDLADETGTYSNTFEDTHVKSWAVHNGISTADYYDYVRNSCVKAFYGNNASHEDYEQMDAMLALANLMTDEERARFNELANGSYGAFANEADEYFEYLYKNVLPERFKAYVDELNGVFTDTTYGKIGQSALSVLTNLGEGITGPIHTLTTNYNDSVSAQLGSMKYTSAQAARESVSKDFSPVGKFFYDTGMSMADSASVAMISGGIGKMLATLGVPTAAVIGGKTVDIASKAGSVLGGSILGGSAFNSAYKEALDRGLAPDKARTIAVGQGFNEMLFESLSLDLLVGQFQKGGILKVSKNGFVNWAVNTLVQGGVEGSEEVFTDIANRLWDNTVNGIYSEELTKLREYIGNGMSYEDAKRKVEAEYAEQLGMSFLGGFVSGGVMGGGASFMGMLQNHGNEKFGKGLRQNSRAMNMLRNFDYKSEYAQEILTQDKLTNQDVADLFNIMQQELLGRYKSDIQKAVADGKITQEQADILKQYEQNGVQIVKDGKVIGNAEGITVEQMPSVHDAIAKLDNAAKIQFLNNEEMRSLVKAVGGETAAVIEQSETAEREAERAYRQTVREINNDATLSPEQKQERLEAAERTRQNARSEASKIADAALTNKKGIGAKLETDGNGTVKVGKGSGKVTYDFSTKDNPGHQTVDSMTATEQSALRIAKIVAASRPDVDVKVEAEFGVDENGIDHSKENGYYNPNTKTIHINMSGDNSVLWTLSHELTHHLANTDTEAYAALRTAIETALKDSKLTTTELEDRGFEYDLDRVDPYIAREGNLWDALVAFEREEHGYGKDAEEEVVARCCESFLGFNQFVKDFARKQYKSAKAVNKFIAQMNIDMQRVSEEARENAAQRNIWNDESPENQILRQLTEIDRIANLWRIAVNAEAKKNKVSGDTKNEDIRYSFRGRDALYSKPGSLDVQDLRDKQGKANLNIAYKMDREGIDSEKIRLATGWFKGYDGKWRSEIDDSEAKLADWLVLGKAINYMEEKARKAEGDLWDRISSLEDRIKKSNKVNGSDSEQSKALRKELRQTKKQREEVRDFSNRISTNRLKLSDILDHAKLYENYPQLKDVSVHLSYSDRTGGYLGSATGTTDITIVTDRNSKGEILETLMHEVQHIIQGIEGFAKGANVEYWADRNKRESADVKEAKATLAQVERELARVKYDGNPQASPLKSAVSYAYITDLLRTDKPGTANYAYDTEQKEKYEKRAEEGGYADLLQKYLFAYQDVKVAEMEAKDYTKAFADYQRTAGEVEARDVASRLHMSEDERKATRPDIDRSDVTFFETDRTGEDAWKNEDIRYSKADKVKLSSVDSPAVNRIADESFPIQPKTNRAEAKYEKTVAHDTKVRLADIQDSMFHPVMRSIKDAVPISDRTLAKARSLKEIPYNISMYENTEKAIVDLAKFIKENYSGKYDVQGNLLLPEETVQSNNIFSNASYLKDAEPTTECYRQTIYRAFLKVVTDQLGRPVTEREAIIVNQACIEIGLDAPCIYCYSLLDRKAKEGYKLQYLSERDAFLAKIDEEYHGDIEAFKRDRAKNFDRYNELYLSRVTDPAAYKDGVYDKSMARKGNAAKVDRVKLWLDVYESGYHDGTMITANDVRNIEAEEASLKEAKGNSLRTRELKDILYWSQSASQAKKIIPYSAYTNDGRRSILSWSQNTIDALNREYGLRWYSHADFHPAFIVDNMQQIMDASVKGLKGLMYVKPVEAAKIFAPTGMLINVSCFAQYKNGQYVADDRMGADWTEVQNLRKQYENVGAVMVVTTDDMWMWAMTRDWVDVIIPLHLVRSGSEFVDTFGLHNYSEEQADKLVGKAAKEKYEAFIADLAAQQEKTLSDKEVNALKKANKSIYPGEHENDYAKYMEACEKRGLTPRFDRMRQLIEEGGMSWGGKEITLQDYMKCVSETRMPYTKAQTLKPSFDFDAAKQTAATLPEKGFFNYFKQSSEWNGKTMTMQDWVDQAVADINAKKDPSKLGYGRDLAVDESGKYLEIGTRAEAKRRGVGGIHDTRSSKMDKVRLSTADGTRTYTSDGVTAKLYGNDVELDGGKVRQRVQMMEAIAEVYGTARVDAASEEEAEAFRRAGAEQVIEELEGHGAKYGTWEFKYEERKFTNDSRYDIKQKQKFAKDILKQVGKSNGFTQAQRVKYGAALGRLMDYLWEMQYGKMDGNVIFEFADRLFDSILNDYTALSEADEEFRSELLANMTKTKNAKGSTMYVLEVNDKQMREIKYAYENAMAYASKLSKALGARVTVKQTEKAKTLEDIFTYSTDTRIKSDTNEGAMPDELLRLAQETESRKTNPYAAESEERQALKEGMFDAAMNAAGVEKSTAQQIREAVKETRKAERTKAKTEAKKAIDSARLAERMHEGALRAKDRRISENRERALKQHAADREAKLKQGFRETTQKANETRLKRDMRTIALKWNQRLVKLLANPTEASHVPIQLAREVAELTKTITEYLDSGTERGRINLEKVIKAYQKAFDDQATIAEAQKENPKYDPRGTVIDREMYDEYLVQMMNRMNEIVAEKSFKDLSAYEMKALLEIVRGVAHTVYDANRMIGTSERRAYWEVGDRMVSEMEEAPSVSARKYLNASLDLRRLALIYNGSNENAEMVKLVGMLNDGAIEKERVAQQLSGMFSELTAEHAKEMRKWYGKNAEWIDTGIVKHGKKVEITKGMRISLAMHVLNEGNMNHITNGGITIPDRELYNKGKLNDAYANGTLVRLDEEQIHTIISQMTETEKAYLEIAKEFFHKRTGYYVNKTSLQLLGYRKATVENYFPIHTDKNYTKSDFASVMRDGSIEGQGFLKERVMATNPVYLEDITSVVNRQIKGVSLYAGLAVPMRNFNAVMNASIYEDENGRWLPRTTVRKTMTQKMGDYGAKVVQEFLQDVSGMSAVDVKPSERIVAKLQTRYVKAVLLANLKVTLKQAASYPTAAAVIPWKYLRKALRKGGRNHRFISRANVELINQYTPLYQMRRDGMANEITSIMAERGLEQKMPWLLGWITKMDVATVGRLWSACEYMVADQQKNLPVGSDEYYKAVAKVFNKTIQETQPNFTPLQRNAALRSKNPIVRTLVLFGTQRMQNGGILIENAMAFKQAKTPEARKAARVKLGRAVASQIIQNALLIVMGFAVDALRGRMKGWNDEDKELTEKSVLMNVGDQFMSNILGSFLGGSEIWDIGSGLVKKSLGKSAYDTEFTIPALDALETIISFGKDEIPSFIRYMAGDASAYEKQHKAQAFTKKLAKAAGYVTGFPFENMVKDLFDGINPMIQDIVHGVDAGEFIPWLHNSGRLDKEKTNTLYKEWTRNGFKGSEFFYWTDKLQGVSGGREGRIPVLMESDLTNEQKALLMRMMDTSGGYEQGTEFYNKNGELIVDFANPTEKQALPMPDAEPSAEPSAEPVAEATPQPTENPLSESKQEGVRQAVAKGVPEQTAFDAFLAYQNMGKNKSDDYSRNDDFRAWLFKNVKKPEERAILEYQVIGQASKVEGAVTYRDSGVVYRDYTNESWFKLSEHNLSKDGTNKRYEAGKRLEKTGLSVDKTVAIYDGLKELTKKAEWTDYLKKQGLTEEQINIFLWSRGWAK